MDSGSTKKHKKKVSDFDNNSDDKDNLFDGDTILVDRTCHLPIGGGEVIPPEQKLTQKKQGIHQQFQQCCSNRIYILCHANNSIDCTLHNTIVPIMHSVMRISKAVV